MRKPKQRRPQNDLSRSLTPLDVNHTLIAVIELSQKSWLVAGIIPGVERQALKKLGPDAPGRRALIAVGLAIDYVCHEGSWLMTCAAALR